MSIDSIGSVTTGQEYQSKTVSVAKAESNVTDADRGSVVGAVSMTQAEIAGGVANSAQKPMTIASDGTASDVAEVTSSQQDENTSLKDVKDIRKIINNNTVAEFGYNEPTNRITIKIKDKETDEVIKEIPSEKVLEMLAKAWELAGVLVDEKR